LHLTGASPFARALRVVRHSSCSLENWHPPFRGVATSSMAASSDGWVASIQERRRELEGGRPALRLGHSDEPQEQGSTGEDSKRTDEDCLWPLRQLEC
jgi:hypothetical protein